MTSRSEQISAALLAALQTVPDLMLVERNRTSDVPDGARPAVLLYDGDEEVVEYAARRPGAPVLMEVTPEIWLYVAGPDATLGTAANALLEAVMRAVFGDGALQELAQPYGAVLPVAVRRTVGKGRQGESAIQLQVAIRYPLDPANP